MERRNLPAAASMLAGVATVGMVVAGFCAGMLPFGLTLALATLPVQLVAATAALGLGLVGYRAAARRGAARGWATR